MFVVQSLNILHGPNLFHALPGVRFRIQWPDGFGNKERAATSLALDSLSRSPQLGAFVNAIGSSFSKPSDTENSSKLAAATVQATLDCLTSRTAAPGGYVVVTEDAIVGVHHTDAQLATFAAHVGLTVASLALRASVPATPVIADLSAIEATLNDAQTRWGILAIGETGWRKNIVASRRGIPWQRLFSSERILQYGYGRLQKRMRNTLIESDGQIATTIATNKHLASELLRNNGLPMPRNGVAFDRNSAIHIARSLGFPVVVKPNTTDFGTAVSVNLRTDAEVAAAFDRARQYGPVLVEKHLPGDNCRLLVMHGRFLSAVQQTPAHVVGDGVRSVEQLVVNTNAGRSNQLSERLKKIAIDDDVLHILAKQGLTLGAVPPRGQCVALREHSNLSVGGTFENINEILHPDNKMLAERAAEIVGLTVAGIDFITTDPSRSYLETGGAICEINPAPGFIMGEAELKVEEAFLDGLFPNGSNGRIPLIAVLCDDPVDELVERLEQIARSCGHDVYAATSNSLRYAGQTVAKGHFRQSLSIGAALQNRSATAAIVHLTRSGTAEEGLVFDRCDLAIIFAPVAKATASNTDSDSVAALLAAYAGKVIHYDGLSAIEEAAHELFRSSPPSGPSIQQAPTAHSDPAP